MMKTDMTLHRSIKVEQSNIYYSCNSKIIHWFIFYLLVFDGK
ncbi:hypothetical protein [Virgibacillus pantothenticus]|nr:hypothetical protein [Virgibacillus pantothenticus]